MFAIFLAVSRKWLSPTKGILKAYEKYELKPQLLKAEAEKNGEDLSEYESFTGQEADNSLVELLEQIGYIDGRLHIINWKLEWRHWTEIYFFKKSYSANVHFMQQREGI